MAKVSGPWLRGAKKKLAGVVLQKGGSGETIAREWVKPKNPQTQKQMAQRIIFATVAQAAKFMAPIVNHSFEGVEYGEKSLQRFKQLNLRRLRELASWDYDHSPAPTNAKSFMTTRRISELIPNTYIVSDGSLAGPRFILDFDAGICYYHIEGLSIPLVENSEVEGYGVYTKDLVENFFGLQGGDEIALVFIESDGEVRFTYADESGQRILYTNMRSMRVVVKEGYSNEFILLSNDGTSLLENATENLQASFRAALNSEKSNETLIDSIEAMIVPAIDAGNLVLQPHEDEGTYRWVSPGCYIISAGFIRSNGTKRSRCTLEQAKCGDEADWGLTWNVALDAWFRGEVIAESNRFLNEGGAVNEIG